ILSVLFYTISAWLPTMLTNLGLISSTASRMLSVVNFAAIPCALIVSLLVTRTRTQIWATTAGSGLLLIGLLGIFISPTHLTLLWVIIFGLGHGTSTGVAYSLPLLRSRNARTTAELGGMSQTAGYLLAAVGPVGAGYIHDVTKGWEAPILILVILVITQLLCGLLAGRDLYVSDMTQYTSKILRSS
ncbi:MAG TPA: hypothetical protein VK816_03850, partial [Jatrophihabitantaceae bacterium]|nr:hypothetical protein [Jatrophihabitantaceae bacterium]